MTATETSAWSLRQLRDEGQIGAMQELVLQYVNANPNCSDREIANGLGLKINQVTGRRNELVWMGFVEQGTNKYDEETDREVHAWMPTRRQKRLDEYEVKKMDKTVVENPDSIEIGTPSKGGAVKVYGDFQKPDEFKRKIENAKAVREFAQAQLGVVV